MNLPDTEPVNDESAIWSLQLELLTWAEALLGQRDPSKLLCKPDYHPDGPQLRFNCDQNKVWAELSPKCKHSWTSTVYDLAHETIHLLDPIVGTANYLEEGVAVAFTWYVRGIYGFSCTPPTSEKYERAFASVKCLPEAALLSARRIRSKFGCLSAVTSKDLLQLYPDFDHGVANLLASKFKR